MDERIKNKQTVTLFIGHRIADASPLGPVRQTQYQCLQCNKWKVLRIVGGVEAATALRGLRLNFGFREALWDVFF